MERKNVTTTVANRSMETPKRIRARRPAWSSRERAARVGEAEDDMA